MKLFIKFKINDHFPGNGSNYLLARAQRRDIVFNEDSDERPTGIHHIVSSFYCKTEGKVLAIDLWFHRVASGISVILIRTVLGGLGFQPLRLS
jgi:hypothetical protein